ncbi:nodulation protein NfeD [Candidatus Sumerlaeota bacterium]|nr:nodulation protein NfeD [Candidatus Sumerlaeota bacterium]
MSKMFSSRQKYSRLLRILTFSIVLFMGINTKINLSAARPGKKIMVIPVNGTIDSALPFFVKRGVVKAKEYRADAIILDINTLGGDARAAVLIRDSIVESRIPTYAYISRAISAGALIAISTDHLWMVRGGTIGAAQPYMTPLGGQTSQSPVPEGKLISYLSGEFASTARRKGHNEDIARAFVDPDYGLKGIQEKGRPLTLSEEQALEQKFIEGVCENFDDFLLNIGFNDAEARTAHLTNAELLARFISDPTYSWIFLLIGIMGLVFEFKTPGFTGGGLAGGIALVLFFWGNHLAQLTSWFEILLFLIGVGLLILEIFVIPGFGLAGIAGIGMIFLSIFLAMIQLPPEGFGFGSWRLVGPVSTLAVSLAAGTVGLILVVKYFPKTGLWRRLELQTEIASSAGHVAPPDLSSLLGVIGETESVMRPSGSVRIQGIRYDAKSECGFIPAKTQVKVIRIDAASLVVEPVENDADPKE